MTSLFLKPYSISFGCRNGAIFLSIWIMIDPCYLENKTQAMTNKYLATFQKLLKSTKDQEAFLCVWRGLMRLYKYLLKWYHIIKEGLPCAF